MRKGFLYLVALMDWSTRKVRSWQLSNTMDAEFRIEVLQARQISISISISIRMADRTYRLDLALQRTASAFGTDWTNGRWHLSAPVKAGPP